MQKHYKKLAKLLTLALTSVLIATVSAATYSYLYIDGSVTIGSAKIVWIKGTDAPADSTVSADTFTADLDVQPGIDQNFTECVFLKNQDSADHNLTIAVTTAVSGATFDICNAYIFKNSTGSFEYVDTLTMTSTDSYSTYTGNTPLVAGGYYRITFEVKAKSGTSGTADFDIKVTYE